MSIAEAAVIYPKIVIFGDSIVQYSTRPGGFAELFAEKYERKVDVVVRGYEGYNSNHYPVIARSVLRGLGPGPIDAIVLYIGTNDATIKESFQHVDLDTTIENAKTTLNILSEFTNNIIVVVPGYCEDTLRDDRRDVDFERYAKELLALSRSYKPKPSTAVIPIDVRKVLANTEKKQRNGKVTKYDPDCIIEDGLHLTPLGYRKMADAISAVLKPLEPDWNDKLSLLEPFIHLSVPSQTALLTGHIVIDSEPRAPLPGRTRN